VRAIRAAVRRDSAGQALIECLIACLVLVPLWLGIQRIARWQDLQSGMVQQARHVAFAAALSPTRADAIPVVGAFATPLRGDVPAGVYHRDPLSDLAMFGASGSVRHTLERASVAGLAGVVQESALALIRPVDALSPGRPGWELATWVNTRVDIDVALTVDLPDAPVVRRRWSESLHLLVDDGSLPGPREVAARTDALLPETPLDLAHQVLRPTRTALVMLEPAVRNLCARHIDPEQVPRDRVTAERPVADALIMRPWRPAC
jgi:hypothetical protein